MCYGANFRLNNAAHVRGDCQAAVAEPEGLAMDLCNNNRKTRHGVQQEGNSILPGRRHKRFRRQLVGNLNS